MQYVLVQAMNLVVGISPMTFKPNRTKGTGKL